MKRAQDIRCTKGLRLSSANGLMLPRRRSRLAMIAPRAVRRPLQLLWAQRWRAVIATRKAFSKPAGPGPNAIHVALHVRLGEQRVARLQKQVEGQRGAAPIYRPRRAALTVRAPLMFAFRLSEGERKGLALRLGRERGFAARMVRDRGLAAQETRASGLAWQVSRRGSTIWISTLSLPGGAKTARRREAAPDPTWPVRGSERALSREPRFSVTTTPAIVFRSARVGPRGSAAPRPSALETWSNQPARSPVLIWREAAEAQAGAASVFGESEGGRIGWSALGSPQPFSAGVRTTAENGGRENAATAGTGFGRAFAECIAEDVIRRIEKRMRVERERRGR